MKFYLIKYWKRIFSQFTKKGRICTKPIIRKSAAYISSLNSVLISDPGQNKIGIHDAKSLKFRSWLQHPDIRNGNHFNCPTNLLLLNNGHFFILEKNQINVLNKNFAPHQKAIGGTFLYLKQGQGDVILTSQLDSGPW